MKKILILLFLFVLFPVAGMCFEIKDLSNYSSVGIKRFTLTDSLKPENKNSNKDITGTIALGKILGHTNATFKTEYVYISSSKNELLGKSKWYYYYPKSWNGRAQSKLKYEANEVMKSGTPGDTVVVAKKSDDEILLLIVQQNSPAEKELYNILGMSAKERQHISWWKRLWSSWETTVTDYDIDETAIQMPTISEKSWARIYFTPGPECENNIVASIDAATRAIDVAVYSITNDKIVDSLIAAYNRGVNVRVISDKLQSTGRASLIGRIQDAGIPVVLNKKHKIMHNKFAIFDNKDIETGSYNWTSSATKSNAENCMFFAEQDGEFSKQFKHLWKFYQSI